MTGDAKLTVKGLLQKTHNQSLLKRKLVFAQEQGALQEACPI
jgi:hypothetical protein